MQDVAQKKTSATKRTVLLEAANVQAAKVMSETKRLANSKVVEMVLKPDSRPVSAEPGVSEGTPPAAIAAIGGQREYEGCSERTATD